MLTTVQAIIFGLIQGITELFPISSLGHSVILPRLLHWQVDQANPYFLTFLVATHAATSLVLLGFFWRDWARIIQGIFRSIRTRDLSAGDPYARLGWLLVVGTVPAGILGLLLEDQLKLLFAAPRIVAAVLILNGLLLIGAEALRRRAPAPAQISPESDERIARLSWSNAVRVGLLQCLALIPGFSRTGATITGGLLIGLSHEDAARFSFLLATPIIAAAAFLKLPELTYSAAQEVLVPTLAGALAAGIAAYLAVRFLVRYFRTETLTPFGVYCLLVGAGLSVLFLFR
jgi:undecaprenyl-diphosphatase